MDSRTNWQALSASLRYNVGIGCVSGRGGTIETGTGTDEDCSRYGAKPSKDDRMDLEGKSAGGRYDLFSGESIVCDAEGGLTAAAGNAEELLLADVHLSAATQTRKTKPYTALRRMELYE